MAVRVPFWSFYPRISAGLGDDCLMEVTFGWRSNGGKEVRRGWGNGHKKFVTTAKECVPPQACPSLYQIRTCALPVFHGGLKTNQGRGRDKVAVTSGHTELSRLLGTVERRGKPCLLINVQAQRYYNRNRSMALYSTIDPSLILLRTYENLTHSISPSDFFFVKESRMSVCFCPSKALSSRLLGSLTLMLLLRSSASFLVRSSGLPASAALDAARHRGGAASARALAFSSYKGRSLSASVDLGGSAVTRLDKAVDVFGEKQPKKEWDYVAHHPR